MFYWKWDDLVNKYVLFLIKHMEYWVNIIYLHIVYLQFTKSLFLLLRRFGLWNPYRNKQKVFCALYTKSRNHWLSYPSQKRNIIIWLHRLNQNVFRLVFGLSWVYCLGVIVCECSVKIKHDPLDSLFIDNKEEASL